MKRTSIALLLLILGAAAGCAPRYTEQGLASWYGPGFVGKRTASSERFVPCKRTAAHLTLPFGTRLRVTNLSNGRIVRVRVNDRGPYVQGRIIDLSRSAAAALGMVRAGVVEVRIEVVRYPSGESP